MSGFYVVHVVGDHSDSLDWYEVHATRKAAMESANEHAAAEPNNYPNGSRFNKDAHQAMESQGYVEVSKTDFLYFGA